MSSYLLNFAVKMRYYSIFDIYLKPTYMLGVSLTVTCIWYSLVKSSPSGMITLNSFIVSDFTKRLDPPTNE